MAERKSPNPYAYEVVPPVGRLLDAICDHCGVGGTIRPRNRALADWAGYASAGHIAELLDQLACDGRITYDRETGLITRLFDPEADQMIPDGIDSEDNADSALIPRGIARFAQQDAENDFDPERDQNAQCMEDSCLTTSFIEPVVVSKIPCGAESIPPLDHPILLLLLELGARPGPGVFARGMAARDWTPQQIRDRWEFDQQRIADSRGKWHIGIFWTAFIAGEVAPPRADPQRPLDPRSYADDPAFALGGAPPSESARRNALYRDAHWRAVDLLGPGADFHDMAIVVEALVNGATDAQALAALAEARR